MSEDIKTSVATPAKRTSKRFLVIYSVALFAVCSVLLLLSYFITERNNSRELTALSDEKDRSIVSAMQSVEALQADNESLTARVQELEEQLAAEQEEAAQLQADLQDENDAVLMQADSLRKASQELTEYFNNTRAAYALLWEMQKLYTTGYRSDASDLFDAYDARALSQYLSDAPEEGGSLSALEGYQALKRALGKD